MQHWRKLKLSIQTNTHWHYCSGITVWLLPLNLLRFVSAEYQLLCGNQAPGFIIDIHTGKPIGKVIKRPTLALSLCWLTTWLCCSYPMHYTECIILNTFWCCFVQTLMSVGRSQVSVPMECVSTRLGASAVNAPWASATTTYCSFVKVNLRSWMTFHSVSLSFFLPCGFYNRGRSWLLPVKWK